MCPRDGPPADPDLAAALYALAAIAVRRMPRDISLTTAGVLYTLERNGPQRVTALAEIEGVTQPSMTALVTRLERDGLAVRRPDPSDRRVVVVALTAKGERYVQRRRTVGAAAIAELVGKLPAEHLRSLRAALPAFLGLLDESPVKGSTSARRSRERQVNKSEHEPRARFEPI